MTDNAPVPARLDTPQAPGWPPPPVGQAGLAPSPGASPTAAYNGPVGTIRSTGLCMLLFIITLGIYGWVYYYKTHEEMKRHSGTGIGGGLALVLGILVGFVMWFLTPAEIGGLYERRGLRKPVSGATGVWALLLGWFFGVGYIVWFVETNGALNAYWRSQGVVG